jgi:hypothetical protein
MKPSADKRRWLPVYDQFDKWYLNAFSLRFSVHFFSRRSARNQAVTI